ncbi:MAG: hypothetical protein ABIN80_26405 [Dyadobacter sp.]|uniref:hypothetical protein n=1 Tax=Dyadobacter sp. TaxID=1914288 RepID=UPI003264F47A
MKTRILSLFAMVLLLSACDNTPAPTLAPETIFDSPDMQAITSVFNRKLGTTSTLYGNNAARIAASAADSGHLPGEIFTLVTWELVPNPYWFGGNINGERQVIETVKVLPAANDGIRIDYEIENTEGKILTRSNDDQEQRINFIFGQKASVFP